MNQTNQTPYLFLLIRDSAILRREAAGRLRELGMRVVAQYGTVAIEALATQDEAEAALETGLFAARLSGAMLAENMEKLSDEQRKVVAQWNTRFSPGYRRLAKDYSQRGKSWGGQKGQAEPLPYSQIDAIEFIRLVEEYEKSNDIQLVPPVGRTYEKKLPKPMTPKEFERYERRLAKAYQDEAVAYHLARLAYQLGPRYYTLVANLPLDLLELILKLFFSEASCWRMDGEIAVGIVFVESSRAGGPKFSSTERAEICQEIIDGHTWLASQHPTGNLSWVYETQFVQIDVANGTGDPNEAYWRDPAMAEVTFNGNTYTANWSSVASFREDLRIANWAAHAIVIFVTPYANSWHAYASNGRITLANKNNWGGWGRAALDTITAHESCHLFGSADEYTGSGTPCSSCSSTHGCDQIPNGNCGACSHPHQQCIMDANTRRLCAYTKGQIGWGHLFVETTTADELFAGTDDNVTLDIGDRVFVLDTLDWDDRERNNREAYAFYEPHLTRDQIRRILIRKSEDGFAGGWKLKGVRVWYRGELICNEASINQWLEDDHRIWLGCVNDPNYVCSLSIRVTTADVGWAGTDDDVTLTLAGRNWNLDNSWHDDFERGNTDTFDLDPQTGLRISDIHSIKIHKSPDGFAGGWKLKGVRLLVNGGTLYNNQSINTWLEDKDRTWSDSF